MMAVIDIRGTHGSGKSWVVHQLLTYDWAGRREIKAVPDGRFLGYSLPGLRSAVVGHYDNVCGGCDGVGRADEVCNRVRMMSKKYPFVVLEGILVSHTFERYNELAQQIGEYTFCFLDTPLEICIERVKQRRLAAGNEKPFNPKNVIKDWHCVWGKLKDKFTAAGRQVVVLDHTDPMPQIMNLLGVTDATP